MEASLEETRDKGTAEKQRSDELRATRTDLWMVQATIQVFKLDAVALALQAVPGFGGMTVLECRGFGRDKVLDALTREHSGTGHTPGDAVPRAIAADFVDFTPKLLIQIAVAGRAIANAVVATIRDAAHTGRRGDGKIFVWPLARAVHIQHLAEDAEAL